MSVAPPYGDETADHGSHRTGQVLCERWTIEGLLGVGGTACVYRARHHNGKQVAVKIMHPDVAVHPVVRERLYAEARISNLIRHPNVVEYLDEGVTPDGCPFLVMDFVDGVSAESLQQRGRMHPVMVLRIGYQVLDVLARAHELQFVHRDVKPGNILCCADGSVRLLDFGIARTSTDRFATQCGAPLGTPTFMSPEQARGDWHLLDGRGDIWSVGATLFTLLAGRTVRLSESLHEELRAAREDQVISLGSVCSLRPSIVQLVDKALRFDPNERFSSAREMQSALSQVLAEIGAPPCPIVPRAAQSNTVELASRSPEPPSPPSFAPTSEDVPPFRRRSRRGLRIGIPAALAAVLLIDIDIGARQEAQSSPRSLEPEATLAAASRGSGPRSEPAPLTLPADSTIGEPGVAPLTASAGLSPELVEPFDEPSSFADGAAPVDRRPGWATRAQTRDPATGSSGAGLKSTAATSPSKRTLNKRKNETFDPYASRL